MPSVIMKNGRSASGDLGNYVAGNPPLYRATSYREPMPSGSIKPTAAMKGFFKRLENIGKNRIPLDVRDEEARKRYHEGGRINIKKELVGTLYEIICPPHENEVFSTEVNLDTLLKSKKEEIGLPIYQLLKGKGAKTSPIGGYKPGKKIDFETFNNLMTVKWYVEVSPYISATEEISEEIFSRLNVIEAFYFLGGLGTLAKDEYEADGLKKYIIPFKTDFNALLKQPGLSEMIAELIKMGISKLEKLKGKKRKLPMKDKIIANCDYVLAQPDESPR